MSSNPPLLSLPGQIWPRVLALDRVLSMDQIEMLTFKLKAKKLLRLN